ncbi:MAG: TetR/AcrR family transcriptional regulator [Desulfobacterales bacterium]|nr:MAG: TetR/AcrR family transcriptional regulator [Desulfobacterales bacterium]
MMNTKGNQTRKDIIQKSLQIFSVKGYFNTSINDILSATGLTKGGLYGHFRSKEDIWYAVYDEALSIWRNIVLKNVRSISNPMERIKKTIENDMKNYLGADIFDGGCFFFNMLAELSGQSSTMSQHILKGFTAFAKLLYAWLKEADQKGMLKEGVDLRPVANFIVISLNGAAPLYIASRDPRVWEQTISQLHFYIDQIKNSPDS